jgi:hypothetical protein
MSRRQVGLRVLRGAAPAVFVAMMCASGVAGAQFTPTGAQDRKPDPEMQTRKVRSGLVIALMAGWGISGASGYPNNANQIGDPAYYSSSDVMVGSGGGLFVGGALADYLNFGFFFASRSFKSHDWQSRQSGFGVRVETFPLVYALPTLKNLGAFAEFGIGSAALDVVAPGYPEASGVQSFIGVGVMYEWKIFSLFGGHAVAGPTLEYDNVFAMPISSGAGILGVRVAFYGGM